MCSRFCIIFQQMAVSKIYIFAFMLLLPLTLASIIEEPPNQLNASNSSERLVPAISEVSEQVDIEIRRQFWYYIRKSDTVYAASIDTGIQYLFFIVYQNQIGTFMAIAAYSFETLSADVRTMIRLGDGVKAGSSEKLKVDPFFMQITVKEEKYVVELDERGFFSINDQVFIQDGGESSKTVQDEKISDSDVDIIDKFIREEYWYYIEGAERKKFQKINMNTIKYALITYNHETGLYLAVANIHKETKEVKINTFVRLGEYEEVKPVYDPYNDFGVMTLDAFGIVPIYFS